ncbi:helix-turn-helix domain-containing protein [Metasolibacillus meyeri]|uniref:helix-turn-helix domain-containing protein n=1 Tax=Metasolibacillus meyeri TaxID=1071052 RepID=UPI000D3081AB|nr:helix-turn-helix domain-containing protein [Metasolibacillus meyeri]
MSLGESLKNARAMNNLTQEDVAKKLYVTRQTVSRWEQNKTVPNIFVLQELSNLYGLSIDDLLSETKEKTQEKEEGKAMKKINWFALFGVVCFNVVLFSGVAIAAIGLLIALWAITLSFVVSPLLLLGANVTGLQNFEMLQTVLSVILCGVGVVLYPFSKKVTHYLIEFFSKYVKYNQKTIYN